MKFPLTRFIDSKCQLEATWGTDWSDLEEGKPTSAAEGRRSDTGTVLEENLQLNRYLAHTIAYA